MDSDSAVVRHSAPELLEIQMATLLEFDERGRIRAPGPRVFVSACPGVRLVALREDIPAALARRWAACGDDELRDQVEAQAPVTSEYRGPAYLLPPLAPGGKETVAMTASVPIHPELVERGWKDDEDGPYFGVVRDGMAVSLCYSARWGPQAAEAGVETAPSYRGRGLVVHAVRAWAAAVQASGRLALYSTQWSNEPSRRVAAKLGGIEYGENWHLT